MEPAKVPVSTDHSEEIYKFLKQFRIDDTIFRVAIGHWSQSRYAKVTPKFTGTSDSAKIDMYFAPAALKSKGDEKKHVFGTRAFWADKDDCDRNVRPVATLPYSALVWSGHGWHVYYLLSETVTDLNEIERVNQLIMADVHGDHCFNANRLMRVPWTWNTGKNGEVPTMAELVYFNPQLRYVPDDFAILQRLDDLARQFINGRDFDPSEFKSRSERDWYVVRSLIDAGASDDLIKRIFQYAPIGEKMSDHNAPTHYLSVTIQKARQSLADKVLANTDSEDAKAAVVPTAPSAAPPKAPKEPKEPKAPRLDTRERRLQAIVQRSDGYWSQGVHSIQLSTFTIDPIAHLVSEEGDALLVNVHSGERTWHDLVLPMATLRSRARWDQFAHAAEWMWLGTDDQLRYLSPFLLNIVKNKNRPRIAATAIIGLHQLDPVEDRWAFVADTMTITPDGIYEGYKDSPIVFSQSHAHPHFYPKQDRGEIDWDFLTEVTLLNREEWMWPILGWFTAATLKPWLKEQGFKFPFLNVTGSRGAGKTTLIEEIMFPIFGQRDQGGFNSATTPFSRQLILAGSNAAPVYLKEFRVSTADHGKGGLHMLLLDLRNLYDETASPRGRGDQTLVQYKLVAPLILDGEDAPDDAAVLERLVCVRLSKETIELHPEYKKRFYQFKQQLEQTNPGAIIMQSILKALQDGTAKRLLEEARTELKAKIKLSLPDRVFNNYAIVLFGTKLWCHISGADQIDARLLEASMGQVIDLNTGQQRSNGDEFWEDIINRIAMNAANFQYRIENSEHVVAVNMATAHTWWSQVRSRSNRTALMRASIVQATQESPYFLGLVNDPSTGSLMYRVDLQKAVEAGLDVPTTIPLHNNL